MSSAIANKGFFAGRTVFISGASRGIGLSIAKKLAADGANVVIAAKTAEPHPKLPGTIYTAAKEIEAAGGKCLPCIVDVRDEKTAQKAIDEAVKKFGGIDILINNASAIAPLSTEDLDMKRYDLMHQINARGTFMLSKLCLPHLKKGRNPHILNISPPLDMSPKWFAPHVGYTMSKFGMSLCVLGMHEEFRKYGIAVNALWPRNVIWTAAVSNVLSGVEKHARKPEIMADAAYVALSQPSANFTGRYLIDDTFLSQHGVQDFTVYMCDPKSLLQPDFFVPDNVYPDEHWHESVDGSKL